MCEGEGRGGGGFRGHEMFRNVLTPLGKGGEEEKHSRNTQKQSISYV